ncbi:unnamed protein product [Nesidiocoris tenuis]|uniref:Uncharacterized protein n=1 Tax=Nesidiocoris tenuis TaxID=355587 RepID=A0A6H5H267_9HEMI|nr:unnamed protein product [Nesidiocoris tenuis]
MFQVVTLSQVFSKQSIARFRETHSRGDHRIFSDLRRRCKASSRSCYNNYINEIQSSARTVTKKFWNHVNYRYGDSPGCLMSCGWTRGRPPILLVLLAFSRSTSHRFMSIRRRGAKIQGLGHHRSLRQAFRSTLSPLGLSLPPWMRVEEWGQMVSRRSCSGIAPIHSVEFSPRSSICPSLWASCPPSGSTLSLLRSLRRVTGLTLEITARYAPFRQSQRPWLLVGALRPAMRQYIVPEQHGFIGGRSTTTSLLTSQEVVLRSFEEGCQVDCVCADFAKAFNKVPHQRLLLKLESFLIFGRLLAWLASYLAEEHLLTLVHGPLRCPARLASGPSTFFDFLNNVGTVLPNDVGFLV